MDIYQMLDLAEELLNLYGYEIYRNAGIVGGEITSGELMQDPTYVPKAVREGIIHRVDILGEKKDIERPFGRICVMYKRGAEKVTPADIYSLSQIMTEADAYYGMYLTNTGITDEAKIAGINNKIQVITEEKLETLIGKATIEQPWWQGYPAFKPQVDYKQSLYYLKYYLTKVLRLSWPVLAMYHHEFTWMPYWKFTYQIELKGRPREHVQQYQGFSAINAFNGNMEFVLFTDPVLVKRVKGVDYVMKHEIVNRTYRDYKAKIGKVYKPDFLPKNVEFNVLKPSLLKHEAKLAAQHHIAKWYDVPPEDVVITGRELIYMPIWRLFMFNRPIVKNIHFDTEWWGYYISAVDGEALIHYMVTGSVQPLAKGWGRGSGKGKHVEAGSNLTRPFLYHYFEWILYTLLGVPNYANLMRRLTWGAIRLYWSFNVRIQRWMLKLLWVGIEGLLWLMMSALGLSLTGTLVAFLAINLFLLPLHSVLYIWHDALRLYPHKTYPHPDLSGKDIADLKKKQGKFDEAETAYSNLKGLEQEGRLSSKQKTTLKKVSAKLADTLLKKVGA